MDSNTFGSPDLFFILRAERIYCNAVKYSFLAAIAVYLIASCSGMNPRKWDPHCTLNKIFHVWLLLVWAKNALFTNILMVITFDHTRHGVTASRLPAAYPTPRIWPTSIASLFDIRYLMKLMTGCWRNYFRKENHARNYLLHIESNESKKNMVPEKTQNSKTIYINSRTHNSTKTVEIASWSTLCFLVSCKDTSGTK